MKFIVLTRAGDCSLVLVNLDHVIDIIEDDGGSFVVVYDDHRHSRGFTVVESVKEIVSMIDAAK